MQLLALIPLIIICSCQRRNDGIENEEQQTRKTWKQRPFTKRHRIDQMLFRDLYLIVFLGGKSCGLLCLLLNDYCS